MHYAQKGNRCIVGEYHTNFQNIRRILLESSDKDKQYFDSVHIDQNNLPASKDFFMM